MHPKLVPILIVLAAVCLAVPMAYAAPQTPQPSPQALITVLPADPDVGYCTILAHDDWSTRPGERALIEHWLSLSEVQDLAAHGRYFAWCESDPIYQQRERANNPILPAIVIQDAQGCVLYKDHGDAVGDTDVDAMLGKHKHQLFLPWRKTVVLKTTPPPTVNVAVTPPPPVPDKVPLQESPAAKDSYTTLLAVSCVIVAVLAGIYFFRRRVTASSTV